MPARKACVSLIAVGRRRCGRRTEAEGERAPANLASEEKRLLFVQIHEGKRLSGKDFSHIKLEGRDASQLRQSNRRSDRERERGSASRHPPPFRLSLSLSGSPLPLCRRLTRSAGHVICYSFIDADWRPAPTAAATRPCDQGLHSFPAPNAPDARSRASCAASPPLYSLSRPSIPSCDSSFWLKQCDRRSNREKCNI